MMSQPTREGAAHGQQEKGPPAEVAGLWEETRYRRPWQRRGHLQRSRPATNQKVIVPAMRNEHGTDQARLPLVYGCRAAQTGTLLTIQLAASELKPISINSSSRSSTASGSRVIELSSASRPAAGFGPSPLCSGSPASSAMGATVTRTTGPSSS